jgi:hypothetical protein
MNGRNAATFGIAQIMPVPRTGDPLLDDAVLEYRRLGNIDVFNNAVAFYFMPGIWRAMGHPQAINDDTYVVSPLAAVMRKLTKESNDGKTT